MSSLIGKELPYSLTQAAMPDNTIDESFEIRSYLDGHYGVIFFYPHDFTFVCPSEIIAFNNRREAFEERGAKIVSISIDSAFVHKAWQEKPVAEGGVGPLGFPMLADTLRDISKDFGVDSEDGPSYRGTFITDKDGIVRHILINDMPLGRNVDETLRTLDALIFHEENGEVCPAQWNKGEAGMKPDSAGVAQWLGEHAKSV